MARPTNRAEFLSYILRRLGDGAIKINTTDSQNQDRIDDALDYWTDYHYAGTEDTFLVHKITQADIDNEFIPVPSTVHYVVELYDVTNIGSSGNFFSPQFQAAQAAQAGMLPFDSGQVFFQRLELAEIAGQVVVIPNFRYNRHVAKIFLDTDWKATMKVDKFILFRTFSKLDEATNVSMWQDLWLGKYATALIKFQWGSNLTKFVGLQLPGGVDYDGVKIQDDAFAEMEKLEGEMQDKFAFPALGGTA